MSPKARRSFFFILAASLIPSLALADTLPSSPALPAPTTEQFRLPIFFESDSLEYSESNQVITVSGRVTVKQSSYTFQSDRAQFDIPEKNLSAWGHVRFRDVLGNQINSESLTYNAAKGAARLIDATGTFQEWLFAAKRAERDDEGNYLLEEARLSTCERDLSKYHLYGHKVRLMPGKRITVQHAVFRLGPVPILYLPYYYYPLGEKHLAFQIFPGQNQSEGPFLRTIWGYAITNETYVKAYLDYLSRRGIGTGGEFDYYAGDWIKGSLYGFRIDDRLTSEQRWNVRLAHWQKISENAILQANGNKLSDDTFPNDFFREDFNRVVRDFTSSTALTYQKSNNYFRLIGTQTDLFNTAEKKFFTDDAQAPRLEWNQVQTPMGFLGVDRIVSANFTRRYAGKSFVGEPLSRDFRTESDAHLTLIRKFRIVPVWSTFVPKVSLSNQWTDRPQGSEQLHLTQRVTTEGTLRQRLGYNVDLDLTHTFVKRLQNNTADDLGQEVHSLRFFSLISLRQDVGSFRFETTHNLPKARREPLAPLERRNYTPLRGEIIVNPRDNMEVFFREEYTLFDPITGSMHPLNTQSEFTVGRRVLGEDYYSFGTSYFATRENVFEIRQGGRWSPTRSLRFEGVLRTLIKFRNQFFLNVVGAEFTEKEILVRKEWRCWLLSFVFRERTGVVEFLFNLELKLGREKRERSESRSKEAEFYPWREETIR